MKATPFLRSAWIVTWEWAGDHARVDEEKRFVTALNYRWTGERVRNLLEQLYIALEYGPWDKAAVAKSKRNNPYPAVSVPPGEVHCGHNPWLRTRRIRNLEVVVNDDGTHQLRWGEPSRVSPENVP